MKKALFLFLLCILMLPAFPLSDTLTVNKPKKAKNIDLEFALGYSIVFGDYGKFNKSNSKSGYAANGWLAQLTFNWLGKRDVGLAFQYTYQRNPSLDTANNVNPVGTDTNYHLGPGTWTNNYLMAGPVYHHYFNRVSVDIKILVGVLLASSPNFSISDPTTKQTVKNTATGFAYQFSAGIGYKISPHFAIKINASYLGASPSVTKEFHYTIKVEKEDPDGNIYFVDEFQTSETTIKKVVSTLNVGIGVIYKF